MDIRFQNIPDQWRADILLAPVLQEEDILRESPELDKAAPWLAVAPAMRDVKGKKGELALLHGHPDLDIPRVLFMGLGRSGELTAETLRKTVAAATQRCRELGLGSLLLPEPLLARLPGGRERLLEECVFASLLSLHRSGSLKRKDEGSPPDPDWLAVGFDGNGDRTEGHAAARRGENAAQAAMTARELANAPGNLLSPAILAERAAALAEEKGFSCRVLEESDLEREGMGALLAVGQGSARPPRLVVLEYIPKGHEQENPVILVGKGITFDSGGISIKPAAKMHQMKSDMSGAAAVLAAVAAAAEEGLSRRVVGLLPCAENMPGGRAGRPGDVVRAANGDSIEITNTDAEGRLVLCDALTYAQEHWTPEAIVDIATLTGACAIALGSELAGLFCDDAALAERIAAAGAVGGEHFWRMPLWKPYKKQLESEVADICHTGPREGGAINAALFLQHFVRSGTPWAHLDIAGVDWAEKGTSLCPPGATGFGARTLLELLRGGVR